MYPLLDSHKRYDRKNFKGGHVIPITKYHTIVTYIYARKYQVLVEFYNDAEKLFAWTGLEGSFDTEQQALDFACDIVGVWGRRTFVIHPV